MQKITQYVLLVISDCPIEENIDRTYVRHLINTELHLTRIGEEYQVVAPIPKECNPGKVMHRLIATGWHRLQAILNWLLKVEGSFFYYPFHISQEEESYMDSQPMG